MSCAILWIQNGRVVDPATQRDEIGDVFVVAGKIVPELNSEQAAKAQIIDASGQIVCPGLVDVHVHFRDPGHTHKESIKTGCQAAAQGGFTTVVCMPNTAPPCDNPGTIQYIKDTVTRDAIINVYPTGCLTVGRQGKHLAPIGSLKRAGVVAISDDGDCVQDNEIMRRAVEYAHMFGLVVMDHCQDASLTRDAVMHEGEWSLRLGLQGWPAAAEDIIVTRNVILAAHTGAHIHMQHMSSAYAVDVIRRAKQRGIRVTAELSPHHLTLTDACLHNYNTNFKMNPPLRTEADRLALREGLLDGTLDIIATDHAPHSPTEKDGEFDQAPFGVIGLETSLAVCLEELYHTGDCELSQLIACMTYKGAELLGLAKGTLASGADADITLFDPNERWTVTPATLSSKSYNSPWLGKSLRGKVKMTIVTGKIVYNEGK